MTPKTFTVNLAGNESTVTRYDKQKPRSLRISLRNSMKPSHAQVGYRRGFEERVKGNFV